MTFGEKLQSLRQRAGMRQDGLAHRRSEVEFFAGTVIRKAEKHGLDVPVNRELYQRITAMEKAC